MNRLISVVCCGCVSGTHMLCTYLDSYFYLIIHLYIYVSIICVYLERQRECLMLAIVTNCLSVISSNPNILSIHFYYKEKLQTSLERAPSTLPL